jgi:transposase InsO family protein
LSPQKSELAAAVKEVFYLHRRRYGARRISAELKASGLAVGRRLAASLMKAQTLTAIRPRAFIPKTTESGHGFGFSPNLLRDPVNEPTRQGEVIIGDITYLPLQNGRFCYLATFQDKFTRRIVGWAVSQTMTAQLVLDAFNRARRLRLIGKEAIIHTDRGSQYASVEYRRLLYINGFRQSMSGRGNCYDNALRRKASFRALRPNSSRAVHLSQSSRQNRKSSVILKVITIASVGIQVWAI